MCSTCPITAVNTFILIISSTTVVLALEAIKDGDKRKLLRYLLLTLAAGRDLPGRPGLRVYPVDPHEGFTPSGSLFGGGFYTVTGFHGFHVFIGLIWCLWLIARRLHGKFSPQN